ncbi:hypothetical protein V4S52_22005, partial [Citrobacter freundii]
VDEEKINARVVVNQPLRARFNVCPMAGLTPYTAYKTRSSHTCRPDKRSAIRHNNLPRKQKTHQSGVS